MGEFKNYIIKIIVTTSIVQLGGLLISNEGYKRLYKLAGGVLIIFAFVSLPSCNADLDVDFKSNNFKYSDVINDEFCTRTENMISQDLIKTFGMEFFRVDVLSDYTSLKINVYGYFSQTEIKKIKNHIENKYCTSNDEVVVKNELH